MIKGIVQRLLRQKSQKLEREECGVEGGNFSNEGRTAAFGSEEIPRLTGDLKRLTNEKLKPRRA